MRWFLVIALLEAAALSPLQADKTSVNLGIGFAAMLSQLSLPSGGPHDITQGYGKNPDNFVGVNVVPAGVVTLKSGRIRLGYTLAVPLTQSSFRGDNNFIREPVFFPGWGETYTYSMLTGMSYQSVSIGRVRRVVGEESPDGKPSERELGVRISFIGIKVEQGLDAWNRRNPEQTLRGRGTCFSVFYRHDLMLLELGPVGSLDYGKYGKGSIFAASWGLAKTF